MRSNYVLGIAAPINVAAFRDFVDDGDRLTPGYTFSFTTDLALAWLNSGESVAIFACDESITQPLSWAGPKLTIDVVPRRPDYRARGRDRFMLERVHLAAALKHRRPSVLNAHWTYEFALAGLATSLPTVVTVHDWAPEIFKHRPDPYRLRRLLMQRAVLRRASNLTAPSPYIADKVSRRFGTPVTIIENGVALEPATSRPQRQRSEPEFVFGALNSGWSRLKNVATLLRAFGRVRAQVASAQLRLAGPGYEVEGPAHHWARKHNLEHGVVFIGPLEHTLVPEFMRGLTLFVHPSLEESFGMVLVEAMAVGTPVLGGRSSGAVPWVIGSENTVDVSSPRPLAEAMVRHGGVRHQVAPETIARFDIEQIAERYVKVLRDATASSTTP